MDDKEQYLLEGIKRGSDEAFRMLFDLYYDRLFCIARQYVNDDFIADTVVGDLFFHIWEIHRTLNIQTSLNAYLIRSVRNHAINYLQKNYIGRETDLDGISSLFIQSDEYPLGILLEKELIEVVRHEINKLPPETRQVLILSRMEELKHTEVAEKLQISVNTVKYHIKQALAILRENLKGYFTVLWVFLFLNV